MPEQAALLEVPPRSETTEQLTWNATRQGPSFSFNGLNPLAKSFLESCGVAEWPGAGRPPPCQEGLGAGGVLGTARLCPRGANGSSCLRNALFKKFLLFVCFLVFQRKRWFPRDRSFFLYVRVNMIQECHRKVEIMERWKMGSSSGSVLGWWRWWQPLPPATAVLAGTTFTCSGAETVTSLSVGGLELCIFGCGRVSGRSGCEHCLLHFPGRDQYSEQPHALRGEAHGQACAESGERHPLPLPGLLPSPRLKLERNGSIFYSFRGEGKLQNEDGLKE